MATITDEVRAIIATHVSVLEDAHQYGTLVTTSGIVQLVELAGKESTSPKRLRDFVAFRLREESHVCRYAVGARKSQRFVHQPAECTPLCKQIDVNAQYAGNYKPAPEKAPKPKAIATYVCGSCYVTVPSGAECGFCE